MLSFSFIYRIKIDDVGSLVIQYVRKEDHGRYQCSAKNLAATRDSRPIRLKVHGELHKFFLFVSRFRSKISFSKVSVEKPLNKRISITDIPVISILTKFFVAFKIYLHPFIYLSPNKYKEEFIFEVFNRKNEEFPMGC